jgi:hypothetical protein
MNQRIKSLQEELRQQQMITSQARMKLTSLRKSVQRDAQTSLFHGVQIALELGADPRLSQARKLEQQIHQAELALDALRSELQREYHRIQTANIQPIWEVQ